MIIIIINIPSQSTKIVEDIVQSNYKFTDNDFTLLKRWSKTNTFYISIVFIKPKPSIPT